MPRVSRVVLSNLPHHIIQRGHNRQTVFASYDDYQYYLNNLKYWKERLVCKVYAYCLMTNHVHMIIDPCQEVDNLALLMKRISGRQTRYANKKEKRTGTLWEGRYKSSPIKTEEYLLACCRYVELNPLRAGMVVNPEDYQWSSYKHKAGIKHIDWMDLDPLYNSLGSTKKEREEKYKAWIQETIPSGEWELLRQSVQKGQLTGSAQFIEEVADKIGRRIEVRGQGRPMKRK